MTVMISSGVQEPPYAQQIIDAVDRADEERLAQLGFVLATLDAPLVGLIKQRGEQGLGD